MFEFMNRFALVTNSSYALILLIIVAILYIVAAYALKDYVVNLVSQLKLSVIKRAIQVVNISYIFIFIIYIIILIRTENYMEYYVYLYIIALSFNLIQFYLRASLRATLTHQFKFDEIANEARKPKANSNIKVLDIEAEYYQGNFAIASDKGENLNESYSYEALQAELIKNIVLFKTAIITNDEESYDKYMRLAPGLKPRGQRKWKRNQLQLAMYMTDILMKKVVNDEINTWEPQVEDGKFGKLEKEYLIIKNEQLKGNTHKPTNITLDDYDSNLYYIKCLKESN